VRIAIWRYVYPVSTLVTEIPYLAVFLALFIASTVAFLVALLAVPLVASLAIVPY
jgi:hypothetical protein